MDAENPYWREPPAEAYSRVTNPERFLPLHDYALGLLSRLRATYEVTQSDTFELLPGRMQPFEHARPPVTLTPTAPGAAPVSVAFTRFPSLVVRYGWWLAEPFPSCGCDACDESAGGAAARLDDVLGKVVAGLFREELTIPWFGDARLRWTFGDGTPREGLNGGGMTTLARGQARVLRGRGPHRVQWRPWRPRRGGPPAGVRAA